MICCHLNNINDHYFYIYPFFNQVLFIIKIQYFSSNLSYTLKRIFLLCQHTTWQVRWCVQVLKVASTMLGEELESFNMLEKRKNWKGRMRDGEIWAALYFFWKKMFSWTIILFLYNNSLINIGFNLIHMQIQMPN